MSQLQQAWTLHQAGNLREAERLYRQVLLSDPREVDAHNLLGQLYLQTGQFDLAEKALAGATQIRPDIPELFYLLGCARDALGRLADALVGYERALALRPSYPDALYRRGAALFTLGQYQQAIACFDAVIAVAPRHTDALLHRGVAHAAMHRNEAALADFDAALAVQPDHIDALYNRATALAALFRFSEAARDFSTVAARNPEYPYAEGDAAYFRLYSCDWNGLQDRKARIEGGLRQGRRVLKPLQSIALLDSEEQQLRCARIWLDSQRLQASPWAGTRHDHTRIRIAYVSANFNEHAVSMLMAGVFEAHDRERFEITSISLAPGDGSALRARVAAAFDRFIDAADKTDAEIAAMMRGMETDIAVDLMGHTAGARGAIFAARPAPVQVNYLGYPGTTGADYMDYILADPIVLPHASQPYYSEKIIHLPHCFMPSDAARQISEHPPTRGDAGLPQDGFVFCSFNSAHKIAPGMFAVWMNLLRQVDDSVLWLSSVGAPALSNLRAEAAKHGVAPERLIPAAFIREQEDHLARLHLGDLFLDTLPYNAHTTAMDALWAGLPVLTCMGSTFAGRVGASLLHAAGLPDMVAHSLDEFESMALSLARDPKRLGAIRERLAATRATAALFDTAGFTRDLEAVYARMLQERFA